MSENVENLILEQLRQMRERMDSLSSDVKALRRGSEEGFENLGTRVDGVAAIMTWVAGNVHALEERVEALEARVK